MNNTTKSASIEVNDEVCVLNYKVAREPFGSRQKHTIVYINNPFTPEDLGLGDGPEYSPKGENPELDKAWRKYNKAKVNIQKQLINHAVCHGMIEENLAKELKWSRTAGCTCGCSPGWISKDYRRQSIWLELVSPSKEEEKKNWYNEYASKREVETLASLVI